MARLFKLFGPATKPVTPGQHNPAVPHVSMPTTAHTPGRPYNAVEFAEDRFQRKVPMPPQDARHYTPMRPDVPRVKNALHPHGVVDVRDILG